MSDTTDPRAYVRGEHGLALRRRGEDEWVGEHRQQATAMVGRWSDWATLADQILAAHRAHANGDLPVMDRFRMVGQAFDGGHVATIEYHPIHADALLAALRNDLRAFRSDPRRRPLDEIVITRDGFTPPDPEVRARRAAPAVLAAARFLLEAYEDESPRIARSFEADELRGVLRHCHGPGYEEYLERWSPLPPPYDPDLDRRTSAVSTYALREELLRLDAELADAAARLDGKNARPYPEKALDAIELAKEVALRLHELCRRAETHAIAANEEKRA